MIFSHKLTSVTHEPFSHLHIRKILDSVMSTVLYETNGQAILCDPFARQSFTTHLPNCITNDLNTEFKCDYNLEFKEFAYTIQERGHTIDLVFFDPRYSLTQLKKQYDGIGKDLELWQTKKMWKEGKDTLASMMPTGVVVISLGWNTNVFGHKRGFQKTQIHMFEHQAREEQFTLFVTVEKKVQRTLKEFEDSKCECVYDEYGMIRYQCEDCYFIEISDLCSCVDGETNIHCTWCF